jgi:hypothetical protein
MASNEKQTKNGASDSRAKRTRKRAVLVEKAIKSIEKKLGTEAMKATLGDFIRLLQLQKELQVDEPKEIKITWVEKEETSSTE